MAQCSYCNAETELFENGIPICLGCCEVGAIKRKPSTSEHEIRTTLFQELLAATARNNEANREFDEVIGQVPTGLPHPDGVQRIRNASSKLSAARKQMGVAHNRLDDYFARGIVPDELKRGGR
jgi:hypothetical protein